MDEMRRTNRYIIRVSGLGLHALRMCYAPVAHVHNGKEESTYELDLMHNGSVQIEFQVI